jgi:hypothetical protein
MKSHIDELKDTIRRLHGVDSSHVETVAVKESFEGETIWEGEVEVFELYDHPETDKLYAWYMKWMILITRSGMLRSYISTLLPHRNWL